MQKFIADSFNFVDATEVGTYLYFENVTEDLDGKWYLEAIDPVVRYYAKTPVFLAGFPHPVEEKITTDFTKTIWLPVIFTLVMLFLLIFEELLEIASVEHKKHDE
ncbi:MAG: hypothetical protein HYV28_11015 [Ignavibacteriales bacterium]|nr:hypothetical protein [Ignavibacteriales bacterium]